MSFENKLEKRVHKLLKLCTQNDINCIIIFNDGEDITSLMNQDTDENIISLETVLSYINPEKEKPKNYQLYH